MSGRELDPDGTDSYHPQHPFEQVGHEMYLPPSQRTRSNWPPIPSKPAGPHEERQWKRLPRRAPAAMTPLRPTYGPGFTF